MKIHNIIEEIVTNRTDILYAQVKESNADWLTCSCERCHLDTVCYVLNRVPPQYTISSRGVTYSQITEDKQFFADIDTLIMEGMRVVNSSKRPEHNHEENKTLDMLAEGPVYNFPTFIGAVFDGSTFEPLAKVEITLKVDGVQAVMIDRSWINPYVTKKETNGTYTFWPQPQKTDAAGKEKLFHFEIDVNAEKYDPVSHFFDIHLTSEADPCYIVNSNRTVKIQNLYLFTKHA